MEDKRYNTLKIMIETDNITRFQEIFDVIPKTVVASDLGINYNRFTGKLQNLDEFTLKEIFKLAQKIQIDRFKLLGLILNELDTKKKLIRQTN